MCRTAVAISCKAANSEDASSYLAKKLVEIGLEVENILSKRSSIQSAYHGDITCQTNYVNSDDRTIALNENFNASEVMGIKKKDGVSRGKGRHHFQQVTLIGRRHLGGTNLQQLFFIFCNNNSY